MERWHIKEKWHGINVRLKRARDAISTYSFVPSILQRIGAQQAATLKAAVANVRNPTRLRKISVSSIPTHGQKKKQHKRELVKVYRGAANNRHKTTATHIEVMGLGQIKIPHNKCGYYPCILFSFITQLEAMFTHHKRINVTFFILSTSGYALDNQLMSKFLRRLFKYLRRRYENLRVGYQWVREQEKSDRHHYHLLIMVDANRIGEWNIINDAVTHCWFNLTALKAHCPSNNQMRLKRSDNEKLRELIVRASYFAKVRGKGKGGVQCKNFSSSRIKFKNMSQNVPCG